MSLAPNPRPPQKGDHVFLVDGSSYIFRAYHALPPLNRKSDGLQVNAVLGFCNMLWKLLRDMKPEERPTHLAVVFDKSEKTFRTELYPDYKAHRPEPPDDLRPQFRLIRAAVRAFDIPCLEQYRYEADDLIATYARQACEAGATCTIVASDKDLMQLVSDCVVMYDTMKDRKIGIQEVIEKFGVPPDKVIEVQALIGDSTDNVPGVPGIGVKTAAQLIGEYGDLETLLARAAEIKQEKRRQSLIDNADKARLSKTLVTLDTHVPLDVPIENLAVHDPDPKRLVAFLKAMEFTTLTKRVADATGINAAAIEPDEALRAGGHPQHPSLAPNLTSPLEGEVGGRRPPDGGSEAKADVPPTPPLPLKGGGSAPSAGTGRAPAGSAASIGLPLTGGRMNRATPAAGATVAVTPADLASARAAEARNAKIDRAGYETVSDLAALVRWIAAAVDQGFVALDLVTTSPEPMLAEITGVALALAPGKACYVPLGHRASNDLLAGGALMAGQIPAAAALAALEPLFENAAVLKIGHDLKPDLHALANHGIALACFDDVQLMSYVLDAGLGGHALEDLAARHLQHTALALADIVGKGRTLVAFEQIEIARAGPYCAEQADLALRLWRLLQTRLVAERMTTVYATLERPLVPVLMRMERRGIMIDKQMLSGLSGEFAQKAAALEHAAQEIAGEPFNLGSPKQLGDILFGKFGLPGGKKTKTGAWSTSASVLDDLAEEGHPLPVKILEWRQLTKLKSTYTDLLPAHVNPVTGRIHTSFALAATTTGRLSSSEPNLQNIPIRTEEGRKIRRAFIAAPGMKLVSADYSQIELRLLAEIADIPALKAAFREGLDIHAMTASEMFGVPVQGMPAEVRRRAKAINFGIIYGISAFGLANQLGIPREEAAAYIKKYFERFPGIRAYMDETREFCRKNGFVRTLFGRKCHYPDIAASNPSIRAFNERAAINARLQGTAADIIRRAMVQVEEALKKHKLAAQMLLQVHDELVFEVPDTEVEKTLPVIKQVMEHAAMPAVALSVPLHAEAHAADNWEEAH
jgi:DNA polymerase-1